MEARFQIGEKVKIANYPDTSMIGNEVEIINVHHSNFSPQKGYVDEWLYNVWDGKKSLGWAPECDLEPLQLSSNQCTNGNELERKEVKNESIT